MRSTIYFIHALYIYITGRLFLDVGKNIAGRYGEGTRFTRLRGGAGRVRVGERWKFDDDARRTVTNVRRPSRTRLHDKLLPRTVSRGRPQHARGVPKVCNFKAREKRTTLYRINRTVWWRWARARLNRSVRPDRHGLVPVTAVAAAAPSIFISDDNAFGLKITFSSKVRRRGPPAAAAAFFLATYYDGGAVFFSRPSPKTRPP